MIRRVNCYSRVEAAIADRISRSRETFVTGDAAIVAARLEQAARPGEVLLGEATLRLTQEGVRVDLVGQLNPTGKSEAVTAYRLLDAAAPGPLPRRLRGPLVGRTAELASRGGVRGDIVRAALPPRDRDW